MNAAVQTNLFWIGREWAYKEVDPCIFAEQYMEDESGVELKDYKFLCFNGEPYIVEVVFDRASKVPKNNFYDLNWQYVDVTYTGFPTNKNFEVPRPEKLDEMIALARKLSKDWPFMRVDFYSIHGRIYFGELTFYPTSGSHQLIPDEWNLRLGELITLPEIKK